MISLSRGTRPLLRPPRRRRRAWGCSAQHRGPCDSSTACLGSRACRRVTLAGVPCGHIALGTAALGNDRVLAQQVQGVDGPVHLLRHRSTEPRTADDVPAIAGSRLPASCLTLVARASLLTTT